MHQYATEFDTPESTLAYRKFSGALDPVSIETLEEYAELVAVWHRALTLHHHMVYGTFTGFEIKEYGGPLEYLNAWHSQHLLLGAAGRSSARALSCALTGYYGESAALTRLVVEYWAQAAYLRVTPSEGNRWYRNEDNPHAAPPEFHTAMRRLRKAQLPEDMLKLARDLHALTSAGSHASLEFVRTARGEQVDLTARYRYVPVFLSDYCGSTMEWGIQAMFLILWEFATFEPQPSEWHEEWTALMNDLKLLRPNVVTDSQKQAE